MTPDETRVVTNHEAFHSVMNESTIAVFEHGENYYNAGKVWVNKDRVYVCRVDPWTEYVGYIEIPSNGSVIDESYHMSEGSIEMQFETHGVAHVFGVEDIEREEIREWAEKQRRM